MNYLKSLLAGFFAVVIACFLLIVLVVIGLFVYQTRHPEEGSVGWDPVSMVHTNPIVWLLPVVIFFAGFFWEFRRLTHR
jgi:uncharacterized BrkB/YihY/UPF0761 family membrane protein